MKYFYNEVLGEIIALTESGEICVYQELSMSQEPEETPKEKKRGRKSKRGPYKKRKDLEAIAELVDDPNHALIEEYGKTAIDTIKNMKETGLTAEDINNQGGKGIRYLTFGQIETIYEEIK